MGDPGSQKGSSSYASHPSTPTAQSVQQTPTEPQTLFAWRKRQIAALNDPAQTPRPDELKISDDELWDSVEGAQLKFQRERGTTLTILSPRASGMGHHIGNADTSLAWSRVSNDLIYRLVTLYPNN